MFDAPHPYLCHWFVISEASASSTKGSLKNAALSGIDKCHIKLIYAIFISYITKTTNKSAGFDANVFNLVSFYF